jgi:hypothetical protein
VTDTQQVRRRAAIIRDKWGLPFSVAYDRAKAEIENGATQPENKSPRYRYESRAHIDGGAR